MESEDNQKRDVVVYAATLSDSGRQSKVIVPGKIGLSTHPQPSLEHLTNGGSIRRYQ